MDRVYIVFWSSGGNTAAMASAIADGVKRMGKEAVLLSPDEVDPGDIRSTMGFAMGCPAMGIEILEEKSMEPFVRQIEDSIKDKQIVLFGSYGWGDGEWMRVWRERMVNAGAIVDEDSCIIAHEYPNEKAIKECERAGEILARI